MPAVALTAFARSEDRTRALRAGFLVHLSKPIDPSELVATIASIAGRTGKKKIGSNELEPLAFAAVSGMRFSASSQWSSAGRVAED